MKGIKSSRLDRGEGRCSEKRTIESPVHETGFVVLEINGRVDVDAMMKNRLARFLMSQF